MSELFSTGIQPMSDAGTPATSELTVPVGSQAPTDELHYEVCVVGGGLAGLCAALSSARMGAKTVLVQDRAVLGGNASSEIRMWALGAHGPDARETGIMEEIRLANLYYNPDHRFSVWDNVLYGLAREQDNLDLLLSCAICDVDMTDDATIKAVRGWHLTRQRWQYLSAGKFIDCSGDSILRLSRAPCRWGREAKSSSGEAHAKDVADRKTMGNTILMQLREIDPQHHRPYIAPPWAMPVGDETFPNRKTQPTGHNFWWLEIGGLYDTLDDADKLRDELIALAHGVWAYIKNHPDGRGHAWELEWIGALPGKRENIRYEGDYILTEEDILAEGKFDDLIAHGGWTMDDHPPAGIFHDGRDTTHHKAPSPYGIPYRTLYSHKVKNLWFAGRNISCTHMAMSSTRVMATCATLGQAAGTAAAISLQQDCDNRGVYTDHLDRLQRRLMDQDQWLPGRIRPSAPTNGTATITVSTGDAAVLADGLDRRTAGEEHRWDSAPGGWIQWSFPHKTAIDRVRLTGDSKLSMLKKMPCSFPLAGNRREVPSCLPRDLRIETSEDGENWQVAATITDNYRRLIDWQPEGLQATHLRVVVERGWSDDPAERISLFAAELGQPEVAGPIEMGIWPRVIEVKGGAAGA